MTMTSFPDDQVAELKSYCSDVLVSQEADKVYFLLKGLQLPQECEPATCDALLCPWDRDGYPSRLFFDRELPTKVPRNWNAKGFRILERNWYAISWKLSRANLRLAEMVSGHLRALV